MSIVLVEPVRGAALAISSVIVIVLVIAGYASTAKRLHDMGHSGWWSLLVYGGLLMLWVGTTKSVVTPKADVKDSSKNPVKPVHSQNGWILVGTKGQYKGCEFPLNEMIVIGTDPKKCSLIIDAMANPDIDSKHCCLYPNIIERNLPLLQMFTHAYLKDGSTDRELDIHWFMRDDYYKSRILKLSPHLSFEVRNAK